MTIDRRRLLGAMAVGAAGAVVPARLAGATFPMPPASPASAAPTSSLPSPLAAAEAQAPILLDRARAALGLYGHMIPNRDVIGLVDFSQPSRTARFQLVRPDDGEVLKSWLVAHGSGSDPGNSGMVQRFSNRPGSNASSRGAFVTATTYVGKHGRSQRLIGLEPENNRALERDIVIHAASYVSPVMASSAGRIGRSQGCFAVAKADIAEVLERLGPGRLLFAWKQV